ncbi:SGNH/GDSL hydrolase family protein [Micromonospora sp. M12]
MEFQAPGIGGPRDRPGRLGGGHRRHAGAGRVERRRTDYAARRLHHRRAQHPGGYRIGLWQRLANAGRLTDFVGSAYNGPSNLGDHDHEGHSGWRIDDIDRSITGWLRTANPRTILLHIGTNDIGQNYDVANAPARLSMLIDHIRAIEPNVELFVAQIIPTANAGNEAKTQTFNAALPGIVAQKGPRTHLVDMHSALTTADLADGLHPNAGGYDKMAARWWSALQSVPGSLDTITTHRPDRLRCSPTLSPPAALMCPAAPPTVARR